jgi:hypothetical protein
MKKIIERSRLSHLAKVRLDQALRAHAACATTPCVHRCTQRVPWKDDDYVVLFEKKAVIVLQGSRAVTLHETRLPGGQA